MPDCRAYELVTPADTNGRALTVISSFNLAGINDVFPLELGGPKGESFVYEAYAGPLSEAGPATGAWDVYRADRSASGWQTSTRLTLPATPGVQGLGTKPGGVSPDQGYAFATQREVAKPFGPVDYLRSPDGSFELTGLGSLADEPYAQGRYISAGGAHVVFSTGFGPSQSRRCETAGEAACEVRKLEPKAPPAGTGAVYDRPADGPTHVVSLLPASQTPAAGEQAFYKGSSTDATTIAFQIGVENKQSESPEGPLYVRIHNGEAGEETLEVAAGTPLYGGMSEDGSYIFYLSGAENGAIHRFDAATETDVIINPTAAGKIVNISADGSHVYFICEEPINGQGEAGKPNLFAWSGSSPRYVATVLPKDLEKTSGTPELDQAPALDNWTGSVANAPSADVTLQGPGADSSRTSPDGDFLAFESRARLTPYDNAGHTEIYRWDDARDELNCVSCNPGGQPATGDSRFEELGQVKPSTVIHNLSNDGTRVFFETSEALLPTDTDGISDIYEWHSEANQDYLSLISSGHSTEFPLAPGWNERPAGTEPNLLLSVSPDGSNVFFVAQEALTPGAGENGTAAIYDARVNGGFAISAPGEPCAEEGCKPPAAIGPTLTGAASETLIGAGNAHYPQRPCRRHHAGGHGKKHSRCSRHKKKTARASASRGNDLSPSSASEATQVPVDRSVSSPTAAQPLMTPENTKHAVAASPEVDFGVERFEAELSTAEAAMHPDFVTRIEFPHHHVSVGEQANAETEDITIKLPPGLLGDPAAIPACPTGAFVSDANCAADSQVGTTIVTVGEPLEKTVVEPVYNLMPPHPDREVARLGFLAFFYPVFIDIHVRTASDYGVTATVHDPPGLASTVRARTTLWGDPSSEAHDGKRFTAKEVSECNPLTCEVPPPGRPSAIPPGERKAFMTNPSACQEGSLELEVTTYQLQGQVFGASAPLKPITDCTGLPFAPTFEAEPTSHVAGAPTGLHTTLKIPQHLGEEERATATMREARVTLPAGMQIAAGAANWIGTCSDSQVGYHEEVDADCPDSSKIGTATILSPALSTPIEGTIYQRSPQPGHQFGLWLTSDALGLHIKLPGELEPDPQTGRLTAVFRDLPQVPVEEIDLDVWGGPRAPLQNPDHCGAFTTDFSFSPHSSDPAATGQSQMQINEGCGQGFSPTLKAGVTEPLAGKFSPFVFDLTRPDGDQALRGFSLHLPDGELAKIARVPLCPDANVAAGSCSAGSRIGSIHATTGPGPDPLQIPQPGKGQPQIFLAGPYQGAPFSIVSEVPAQAGPFDLGTLTVRSGLEVEPESGRAVVKADPLPQFFEGVGIAYRNLHAVVDRPEFNLNPTDCRETQVTAEVTSTQGAVAHPSARFQVDGCKALKFKPRLSLRLKGGTKRAQYPALSATLKARKGDANIASASVALPHSEFLAQEHIGTICTRVQFAADTCPKGSVYGKAEAFTPLLDKPLSGPVYLRSSNHPLPDLVVKLGGQLEIDLIGRIDSVHGGIRTSFESVPDAPVTKFVLQMRGGAKSLLTNSTDICRGSHRATAQFKAQNGRAASLRPVLQSNGCGKKKLGKHKKHH